ncbi:MAG TPA: hypothetical protein PLO63_11600 [Syntrophales bacterium]|nr:hypothetical protein [Syntrophales bacterium]
MPGHEQLVTILDLEGRPAAVDHTGQVLSVGRIRPDRSPAPAGDRLSQGHRRRWIPGQIGQGLAVGRIRPGRSPAPADARLSQGHRRRRISGQNGQGLRMVSRDITGGCPDTSSW